MLAENEYDKREVHIYPANSDFEIKKRKRNRSAFISRQSSRYYERLLAKLIQTSENERDRTKSICEESKREIGELTKKAEALEAQIAARTCRREKQSDEYQDELRILSDIVFDPQPPKGKGFFGKCTPSFEPVFETNTNTSKAKNCSSSSDIDDCTLLLGSYSSDSNPAKLPSRTHHDFKDILKCYGQSGQSMLSFCSFN